MSVSYETFIIGTISNKSTYPNSQMTVVATGSMGGVYFHERSL